MTMFERSLETLRTAWQDWTGDAPERSQKPLEGKALERLAREMASCIQEEGGEASARARAGNLAVRYLAFTEANRRRFLHLLLERFDVDEEAVRKATERLSAAQSPSELREARGRLRKALIPARLRLFKQFNTLEHGASFLVGLRAEIRRWLREEPAFMALDQELRELLGSWFDVGFLELRAITWDSPASLLETIGGYEAVHAIRGWQDLKHRLKPDRRCYAFFHPSMPEEPLIFVEIALHKGLAGSIQKLLDLDLPAHQVEAADTALFFSISNTQPGLSGIRFGSFLIKRVIDCLRRELPSVKAFATLSPIPGFLTWLGGLENPATFLSKSNVRALEMVAQERNTDLTGFLRELSANPELLRAEALAEGCREPLTQLCARYLVEAEHPRYGTALDPVAHFHLSNGAVIGPLNWMGDTSGKGFRESGGFMVNYLYRLPDIETNHESYKVDGKRRTASAVRKLL